MLDGEKMQLDVDKLSDAEGLPEKRTAVNAAAAAAAEEEEEVVVPAPLFCVRPRSQASPCSTQVP